MIGTALILWAAVVVYYTVMGRDSGTGAQWSMIPLHSYREVLNGGNPEILRSNLMNVVLFIPGGLLWNVLSRRKSVIATLLIFGLFSLSIEVWQYFFQLGNAECDDVIHNALGSVAGSYMASINRYVLLPQAQLHQNILESEKSRR